MKSFSRVLFSKGVLTSVVVVAVVDSASPSPPGTVGVAAVTAGPGLTNTVTAVKNAQMAESPLLLMGGAAGTLLQVTLIHVLTVCEYEVTVDVTLK